MMKLMLASLCIISVCYLVLLIRSFEYLTIAELKRQARKGNQKAKAVYSIRGVYGTKVFIVLWALVGLLTSSMVVLIESVLWSGLTIAITMVFTVLVHAVLPWSKYPEPSLSMAAFASPVLRVVMRLFSPLLTPAEAMIGAWMSRSELKRINSKEELLDILEHVKVDDDPFSKDELSIAFHAMTFGDKHITDVMTPRNVMKTVRGEDVLSPVILADLHASGFSRFPVIESETGRFIGILYSKDLAELRTNRYVKDVMRKDVYYVNEFTSLNNVLNAFLRTQHHLFMVVNEFEEIVGLITVEDVLEQIIGKKIIDEFDRYDDLRIVARQKAAEIAATRAEQTV